MTGNGWAVDMALGESYMDYEMNPRVAGRRGNRHLTLVQNVYPCAGDDE